MTAGPAAGVDRFAVARAVADAVLYEGYVLYPYRASARKNQLRWQFGVLAPSSAAADGSERSTMRTEVIVDPGAEATVNVRVRFLQVRRRSLESFVDGTFSPVDHLDVDDARLTPWDEAVEHEIEVGPIALLPVLGEVTDRAIDLPGGGDRAMVTSQSGSLAGTTVHHRAPLLGRLRVGVEWAEGESALLKVVTEIENTTDWSAAGASRDEVMLRSLVGVHTLLAVEDGAFVSLLDPPAYAAAAVAGCRNDGTFPVLAGPSGATDVVLSSPIILYDHPAVAPESAGDFCDATEIDEILALRVLTLTDDEKAEARGTDPRAAAIVDRCDDMPPERWERLHGAIRSLQPGAVTAPEDPEEAESVPWWDPGSDASVDPWTDSIVIGGAVVAAGTRVRLHPSRRADAHDLFYAGRLAVVKGVFCDVDGDQHVAVALDDDLVAQELEWQGRYLYFHPDEVEVVA
ncbi:MAG TPA: hypothetical protein VIT64_03635 [Ilumatobacteraceae bacterium]